MSNLAEHARRELDLAGAGDEDMYDGMLRDAVLDIVKMFSNQGHSGMSAGIVTSMLEKLLRFEPLTPLTGEPNEWQQVGPGMWQNRRCSHVFWDDTGPHDIEGRLFREPSGLCYGTRDSTVPVTFPYTPTRQYVDVPEPRADQP